MCGLNAIYNFKGKKVDPSSMAKMCEAIHHRGPEGAAVAELNDGKLSFGFLRLAFTDLPAGKQPIFNEDYSICLIFNGEVYDHDAIREKLQGLGHKFRTKSDSEIIIHLYEQYGLGFFEHLNGEFAFLLWDSKEDRIIAVRDRFGIKPLFFAKTDSELVFSSESKAIIASELVKTEIDPEYMAGPGMGSVCSDMTPFKGIKSLKPGHFMIIKGDSIEEKKYWWPRFKKYERSFEDNAKELRKRVKRAVQRRLVADVPVGVSLSGGMDSTIVCGLMCEEIGAKNVRAFSLGFKNDQYDESKLADQTAKHFGVQLDKVVLTAEDLAENMLKALHHIEVPSSNLGFVARCALSKLVRDCGYKASMTGEGADELFGGYAYFKLENIWKQWETGPQGENFAKKLFKQFKKDEAMSEGLLWQRDLKWRSGDRPFGGPSYHHLRNKRTVPYMHKALSPRILNARKGNDPEKMFFKESPIEELGELDRFDSTRMMSRSIMSNYIIPTLGDRTEMSNSLEGRAPFLDYDVLKFAYHIKEEECIDPNNLREKLIVRKAFDDLLPDYIKNRVKHPFWAPTWRDLYKTEKGKGIFKKYLSSESVKKADLLNPSYVRMLKFGWTVLPKKHPTWRVIDNAMGFFLTLHALNDMFVVNPKKYSGSIDIENRSPSVLKGKETFL